MSKRFRDQDRDEEYHDQGKVHEVHTVIAGDEVTRFHGIGETVLYLHDTKSFSEGGGEVNIEGTVYIYTARDDDASTLTLASPLSADVPSDTRVNLHPIASEKWATVIVEEGEDPVYARIPMSMENNVKNGVREEWEQESASVALRGTEWYVTDIVGISAETYAGGGGGAKILDELDDVTINQATLKDRQLLGYDFNSGQWGPYGPVVHHGTALPADPTQYAWQFFVKHPPR